MGGSISAGTVAQFVRNNQHMHNYFLCLFVACPRQGLSGVNKILNGSSA